MLLEACGRVRRAGRGAAAADWLGGRPSGRILARSLRPRAVAGAAYTAVASRVPQQRRGAGRGARGAGRGEGCDSALAWASRQIRSALMDLRDRVVAFALDLVSRAQVVGYFGVGVGGWWSVSQSAGGTATVC